MNSTQNKKIQQVKETTMIIGIDVGSEKHYFRAFNWRGIELTRKPVAFLNSMEGFNSFYNTIVELLQKSELKEVLVGIEPTGHYWFDLGQFMGEKDINNAKKALSEAQERLNARCEQIKSQILEVKAQVKSTEKSIVDEAKAKGRAALYRVSEFLGIKKRLLDIRENVRGAIKTTDKDIAKTALLAKGFREAGQTAANAFRTFADKPKVDYSQKEQKHPITKAVLAPMKAVRKLFVSMELHLDASIDKLDNLAMNVQLDKEKHMENAKAQEQTEPERAGAERVEAEIVYLPMVAEPQEYQYNADAFEARGVDEVKQEAAYKEAPKVREDKAR